MTSAATRRPNYFDGQQLGAADFDAERDHLDALRHRYNAQLHGSGIATGLIVRAGVDGRSVTIAPGFAVQPSGREIVVGDALAVQVPAVDETLLNLFLIAEPQRADPTQASLTQGYRRVETVATPFFAPPGATVDDEAILLATVSLATDGTVAAIAGDARRPCGVSIGRLDLLRAQDGAVAGSVALEDGTPRAPLVVRAPALALTGGLGVAGGLTIGTQAPRAGFDLASALPTLIAVGGADARPFLTIDRSGMVALGGAMPGTAARLAVTGDVTLDDGYGVVFGSDAGTGSLGSGATDEHGILLGGAGDPADGGTLTIGSLGSITLCSGATTHPPAPTLTIDAAGQVAIGPVATLDQALVVDGPVQSLDGGFDFGDGQVQATATPSTTIQIGGVVEWWSGGKLPVPPCYAICDGSVVDDPLSPLRGKTLPDLTGRYVRGTTDYAAIGTTGGSATHCHAVQQIAAHTHSIAHAHAPIGQTTSSDQSPGDSDTTDSKCSNTDHTHGITVTVPSCSESQSLPNDTGIAGTSTGDASSLPVSLALAMLMRIR